MTADLQTGPPLAAGRHRKGNELDRLARPAIIALLAASLSIAPARAGEWTMGGTYDVQRNLAVDFLRFLALPGEGQMTVRCDAVNGLWVDVGAIGNGQLPAGLQPGDVTDVVLDFVRIDGVQSVTSRGPLIVRSDGAVLVELAGEAAMVLADPLLVPAERLDITVAGATSPVTAAGLAERAGNLAERCDNWPAPSVRR
jgi:hypothetical protein